MKSWCKIKSIPYTTNAEMILNKDFRNRIKREVDCYNKQFGETEQIKKFEMDPWLRLSTESCANEIFLME